MAHPRGIEPRIAVLEAATVTVRSGAWYSRQESNLQVDTRFERAAFTDSATGVKLVGRGRLELPCSGRLVLSEVCLPIPPPARVQGGPRTRKTAALNRRRLPIAPPGHLGARGRTRTYVATKATGLRPVSFTTHSRARVHTSCQRTWRRAGDSNPDVPRRRNLSRTLGYRLPMLSAALRSRD